MRIGEDELCQAFNRFAVAFYLSDMLALLSMPYVYPYANLVAPIMIVFLVVGVVLFWKFLNQRKYVLTVLFFSGLVEVYYGLYTMFTYREGAVIGALTLICVGFLAAIHFTKGFVFRYLASLPFFSLSSYLLLFSAPFIGYTPPFVIVAWALISLGCGILLLIAATRSLFASRY